MPPLNMTSFLTISHRSPHGFRQVQIALELHIDSCTTKKDTLYDGLVVQLFLPPILLWPNLSG